MNGLIPVLALGFFLGVRHAADPDHVIAVTTIVTRHRSAKDAALIGAAWGLGHTMTLLLVGGGIILFSWVIPARVGLSMELAVGAMLVVLGIANLRGYRDLARKARTARGGPEPLQSHPHRHGDYVHTHPHTPDPAAHPHRPDQTPLGALDRQFGRTGLYRLARPLVVGVVHGLAGSAAAALLVLAAIDDPRWGLFYLLVFGAGTILGMMLITFTLALPVLYGGHRSPGITAKLHLASGVVSVVFGSWIAYLVMAQGLFATHPEWLPR